MLWGAIVELVDLAIELLTETSVHEEKGARHFWRAVLGQGCQAHRCIGEHQCGHGVGLHVGLNLGGLNLGWLKDWAVGLKGWAAAGSRTRGKERKLELHALRFVLIFLGQSCGQRPAAGGGRTACGWSRCDRRGHSSLPSLLFQPGGMERSGGHGHWHGGMLAPILHPPQDGGCDTLAETAPVVV